MPSRARRPRGKGGLNTGVCLLRGFLRRAHHPLCLLQMLGRVHAEFRQTVQEVRTARTILPVLLSRPGAVGQWLRTARAAQGIAVCTVVVCVWLAPSSVERLLQWILPPETRSAGFLGLRRVTVEHPWLGPVHAALLTLLWSGGALATARALLRQLPRAVARVQSVPGLVEPTVASRAVDPCRLPEPKVDALGETCAEALPRGDELAGRYRLERKLGQGGMGEVFLALDRVLERRVALKRLPPQDLGNASTQERFRREAKALARLNHSHVVQVFDLLEVCEPDPGAGLWMVLEVVTGGDLATRLQQGRLPWSLISRLAVQMASALQAAHTQGIIHRDFKPANVFLDREENAKVGDFGIASSAVPVAEDSPRLTQTGAVVGTPAYMSPEQARGEAASEASDVYALGATLYEMLTGRPVFEGTLAQVLSAHLITPPTPLSAGSPEPLPEVIESLVLAMLEKNAANRPDLAEVVACFQQGVRRAS